MAKPMDEIKWTELEPGCVIVEPGNAREYKTGDWRTTGHPLVDKEKCTGCKKCAEICPCNFIEMH